MANDTQQILTKIMFLLESHVLNDEREDTALLAVSVPFLEAMGILCCSWQLLNVLAYQQEQGNVDKAYMQNIRALAAFYGAYRLPSASAALRVVENAGLGVSEYGF